MSGNNDGRKPFMNLPAASLPSKDRKLSTRAIDSLFGKFAAIYGTKLADQWAGLDLANVKATWCEALSELSNEEIVAGVQALVRGGKPFPPTLPEFYGHCRPKVDVPPVSDHQALDAMARDLGVSLSGCDSYYVLRQRILTAQFDRADTKSLRGLIEDQWDTH